MNSNVVQWHCQMTIGELVIAWLQKYAKNGKPRSYEEYVCVSKRILNDEIASIPINALKPSHVHEFYTRLINRNYSRRSIVYVRTVLRQCFKKATVYEQLPISAICISVDIPNSPTFHKKKSRALSPEEIRLLLAEVGSGRWDYRYYALLNLLLYTGARIGEAVALLWEDIDFTRKTISINKNVVTLRSDYSLFVQDKPKTAASIRDVPMPACLETILAELRSRAASNGIPTGNLDYVFHSVKTDNMIRPEYVDRLLRKMAKACSIEPFGAHTLRHTYGSYLFSQKVETKIIQELLGHSSITLTSDTYIHTFAETLQKAVTCLNFLAPAE